MGYEKRDNITLSKAISLIEKFKSSIQKNSQEIETKEVYESVISKAECMSKKSEIGFASWCSKRKVDFIGMPYTI